jgi:hypothetical protein
MNTVVTEPGHTVYTLPPKYPPRLFNWFRITQKDMNSGLYGVWNRFAIRLHYFGMHSTGSFFRFFWYERHRLGITGEESKLWFSLLFNSSYLYVTPSHASKYSPRHLIPEHPHSIYILVFAVMTPRSVRGAYLPYCTMATQKNTNMGLKKDSVVLVRQRTIPIERSPPVSEASANFSG